MTRLMTRRAKMKNKNLRNELHPVQKVIMWALLLALVLMMALPMWNVLVVATSSRLSASQSGMKL